MKIHKFLYCLVTSLTALVMAQASFSKSELVQISKDRKIFMNCAGEGSPTVLLISGYPDRGDSGWETPGPGKRGPTVFSAVSKFTKVCDYDRPGTVKIKGEQLIKSRSTATKQPTSAGDDVKDLQALVNAAQIKKPFIIVGHSAGGLIARLYAMKHPQDVSGLILVDATNEFLLKNWSKKEIEFFKFTSEVPQKRILLPQYKNLELIDFFKSFDQLNQYNQQKLTIPTVVLVAGTAPNIREFVKLGLVPKDTKQEMLVSIMKGAYKSNQEVAKTFNPKAQLIYIKKSSHYIQKDEPLLVIRLIKEMVQRQRVH